MQYIRAVVVQPDGCRLDVGDDIVTRRVAALFHAPRPELGPEFAEGCEGCEVGLQTVQRPVGLIVVRYFPPGCLPSVPGSPFVWRNLKD